MRPWPPYGTSLVGGPDDTGAVVVRGISRQPQLNRMEICDLSPILARQRV